MLFFDGKSLHPGLEMAGGFVTVHVCKEKRAGKLKMGKQLRGESTKIDTADECGTATGRWLGCP